MTIEKVEGIVLTTTNYSESSKILNVLTKEYGVIGILSKGCRSLKSRLRSVSSPLVYGFFHIYHKEKGLSTLIGVDVINPFYQVTQDLSKLTYATYLIELVGQVARQTEDPLLLPYFIATLEKMDEGFSPLALVDILELKLLDALGVRPLLDECALCGTTKNILTIDASVGGLVCASCRTNEPLVPDKVIPLLRMFYYVDIKNITKLEVKEELLRKIDAFLEDYYDRYTGIYLKSKKFRKTLDKLS